MSPATHEIALDEAIQSPATHKIAQYEAIGRIKHKILWQQSDPLSPLTLCEMSSKKSKQVTGVLIDR